jgi:hypothetical protein
LDKAISLKRLMPKKKEPKEKNVAIGYQSYLDEQLQAKEKSTTSMVSKIFFDKTKHFSSKEYAKLFRTVNKVVSISGCVMSAVLLLATFLPTETTHAGFIVLFLVGVLAIAVTMWNGQMALDFHSARKIASEDRAKLIEKALNQIGFNLVLSSFWTFLVPLTVLVMPNIHKMYVQALRGENIQRLTSEAIINGLGGEVFLSILLLIPPILATIYIYNKWQKIMYYDRQQLETYMSERKYADKDLYQMFHKVPSKTAPTFTLGIDIENNSPVSLTPKGRATHSAFSGATGTGKSQSVLYPMIAQDLEKTAEFIREFYKHKDTPKFWKEDISGDTINGFTLIEPSGNMAEEVFKMLLKMGYPREFITYLNPLDPHTDSVNLFSGDPNKVAETMADIFAPMKNMVGNEFFKGKDNAHIAYATLLLMFSWRVEGNELDTTGNPPNMEDFVAMYVDKKVLVKRVMIMEQYRSYMYDKYKVMPDKTKAERIAKDEAGYLFNTINETYKFFFDNITIEATTPERTTTKDKDGNETFTTKLRKVKLPIAKEQRKLLDTDDIVIVDELDQYIEGLRGTLQRVSRNPAMRRMFFKSSSFDFDQHLKYGGVLLISTAYGELQDLHSKAGQLASMAFMNATYRRPENISAWHSFITDELPEYRMEAHISFAANSRKHKVFNTVAFQNLGLLNGNDGNDFANRLLGNYRSKFTFEDMPPQDSQWWSDLLGKKWSRSMERSGSEVSLAEGVTRNTATYREKKERVENVSSDQLASLGEFTIAGRYNDDGELNAYSKIRTLPYFEFRDRLISIFDVVNNEEDKKAFEYWLSVARKKVAGDQRVKIENSGLSKVAQKDVADPTDETKTASPNSKPKAVTINGKLTIEQSGKNNASRFNVGDKNTSTTQEQPTHPKQGTTRRNFKFKQEEETDISTYSKNLKVREGK